MFEQRGLGSILSNVLQGRRGMFTLCWQQKLKLAVSPKKKKQNKKDFKCWKRKNIEIMNLLSSGLFSCVRNETCLGTDMYCENCSY